MKKALLILFLFPLLLQAQKVAINPSPKTYYIAASGGSNSNTGLTTAAAWSTLTYAVSIASPVVPGDTIFVKAGNYGNENVVFQKNGVAGSRINVIGYKTTPRDVPPVLVNLGTPYTAFTTTDMPTYTGSSRASGICLDMRETQYVNIKNFQIGTYLKGVTAGSATQFKTSKLTLENINCQGLGANTTGSYSGQAFLLGDMGTKFFYESSIINCQAVNCCAEGFGINGDNNTAIGCKAYCNEHSTAEAPLDYYFYVCGNYNTISNCYLERDAAVSGGQHGFTVKTNAEQVVDQGLSYPVLNCVGNKFFNCSTSNIPESFCVRHRGAQYNIFYKCTSIGIHTGTDFSSGAGDGIAIRDGASNNTFSSILVENCESGISFSDTTEDGDTGGSPPGHPGNYNTIINSVFINNYFAVNFDAYNVASDAGINTIANCTFYKNKYHHYAGRGCANMIYKNNIYHGGSAIEGYFKGNTFTADVVGGQFTNCTFYLITGGMPGGFVAASTAGITTDPLFANTGTLDFHLQATSPSRDNGVFLSTIPKDYDGLLRPSDPITVTVARGAFER